MLKKFKDLDIGEKFVFNNLVWVKIHRLTKSCCSGNDNAQVLGKVSETRTFSPIEKVEVYG